DRDDDRVRAPRADGEALDGADGKPEQERQDDGGGEPQSQRVEEEHRRDRGCLAEGEREQVPAEDDDRQPDGDDADERGGGEDRLHVAHGEEAGGRGRAVRSHPRQHREPGGERDVGHPDRPALEPEATERSGHRAAHGATPPAAWLVVMLARIVAADACARGTTETMRPAKIVTTTSARSSTSSSSVDEKITAVPRRAATRTSRWISARPPTSTPRVGSSSASSAVPSSSSARPSSTFCWLPPLRLAAGEPSRSTGTPARVASSRAVRCTRRRKRTPSRLSRRRRVTVRFR